MKPEPKTITVVCTACGLPWDAHAPGRDATLEDCVRLLKAELAKRPTVIAPVHPTPWVYPPLGSGGTGSPPYMQPNTIGAPMPERPKIWCGVDGQSQYPISARSDG